MEINPHNKTLVVLEAEHNSFPVEQREKFKTALEPQEDDENDEYKIGTPKAGPGIWASCIRVVDPKRLETVDLVELSNNECAVSVCVCNFLMNEQEMFVVVGTAKDMTLYPRTISGASVSVFKTNNLNRLEVVYKFQVEDVPLALCPFYGKLLVGVGKFLRIYEMGKKKMLKKSENKATFPNLICNIKVDDQRIFVSDISESISVLVHRKEDDQIYCFADDVVSRWLSTFAVLDHNTVAAVDKFENFFVLRLPAACEEDEKDIGSVKYKWEAGFLNGAYYKMEHIAHFYLGDLATSLQKCCLGEGGPEILLYATTMGALAALVPLTKKEEVEFFIHLEMYLRQENKPLLGRDHMAFRSFSMPVRNVIDGDLCEQFSVLDFEKQRSLCEELGHPQNEIFKRLEDIKNRIF
jgi:splicing factor 3B subunit 3